MSVGEPYVYRNVEQYLSALQLKPELRYAMGWRQRFWNLLHLLVAYVTLSVGEIICNIWRTFPRTPLEFNLLNLECHATCTPKLYIEFSQHKLPIYC